MRCLTDEQIDQIAGLPPASISRRQSSHIDQCDQCRGRLEQARSDVGLVADILELNRTRREIAPLTERFSISRPGLKQSE